ncbi:MAG: NAD-dependent epimerase/dehydratase family protein [Planctomycetota bacterium]
MELPSKVFVAGHRGMVGSAVVRRLRFTDCHVVTRSHEDLDLCDPDATDRFLQAARPDAVVMTAAKVGGIVANQSTPVEFLSDNIRMTTNVLRSSHRAGISRLLMLGSTCIYPRECRQPMRETDLLTV